jgi:hypothetical protein
MMRCPRHIISDELRDTVRGSMARLSAIGMHRFTLILLQNAPRPRDRDCLAPARGTRTRWFVERYWLGGASDLLARGLVLNVFGDDPRRIADWQLAGSLRLQAILELCADRVDAVVAGGAFARDIVWSTLARTHPCAGWNTTTVVGGLTLGVVPHPSPRSMLNNPGGPGRAAGVIVQPLLRRGLGI